MLKVNGVLLERDCKLTESLDDAPRSDHISVSYNSNNLYTMFLVLSYWGVHMLCCMPIQIAILHQDKSDALNAQLCKYLKDGCVAARIIVYPSYNLLKWKVWCLHISLFRSHCVTNL